MKKFLTITGTALSAMQGGAHAGMDTERTILPSLAMKDLSYAVSMAAPANAVDAVNIFASHASHRSHSSHSSHYSSSGGHSSHSSHSSHYSGSGGSYQSPVYTAPKSLPAPPPSNINGLYTAPRPTADQLRIIVMRVQAALYAKGYDPGAIDGTLGSETKEALRKFQSARGLPSDGKMTTATLNALGVSLNP